MSNVVPECVSPSIYHQLLDLWTKAHPMRGKKFVQQEVIDFWRCNKTDVDFIGKKMQDLRTTIQTRKRTFADLLSRGGGLSKGQCLLVRSSDDPEDLSIEFESITTKNVGTKNISPKQASSAGGTRSCPAIERIEEEILKQREKLEKLRSLQSVHVSLSDAQMSSLGQAEVDLQTATAKKLKLQRAKEYQKAYRMRQGLKRKSIQDNPTEQVEQN